MKFRKNERNKRGDRKAKHMSFGKTLEDIVALKEKAEVKAKHSTEDYIKTALVTGEKVTKQLIKILDEVQGADKEEQLNAAHSIFEILVDTDYDKLIDQYEEYEKWTDLNETFNS